MREWVNQFVRFADNANERCTLSKGFHGGYAHSFHGVPGEGDTRTQSVKRGRRAHIVVAGAARSVPLERKEQIERFAAFQHPNR